MNDPSAQNVEPDEFAAANELDSIATLPKLSPLIRQLRSPRDLFRLTTASRLPLLLQSLVHPQTLATRARGLWQSLDHWLPLTWRPSTSNTNDASGGSLPHFSYRLSKRQARKQTPLQRVSRDDETVPSHESLEANPPDSDDAELGAATTEGFSFDTIASLHDSHEPDRFEERTSGDDDSANEKREWTGAQEIRIGNRFAEPRAHGRDTELETYEPAPVSEPLYRLAALGESLVPRGLDMAVGRRPLQLGTVVSTQVPPVESTVPQGAPSSTVPPTERTPQMVRPRAEPRILQHAAPIETPLAHVESVEASAQGETATERAEPTLESFEPAISSWNELTGEPVESNWIHPMAREILAQQNNTPIPPSIHAESVAARDLRVSHPAIPVSRHATKPHSEENVLPAEATEPRAHTAPNQTFHSLTNALQADSAIEVLTAADHASPDVHDALDLAQDLSSANAIPPHPTLEFIAASHPVAQEPRASMPLSTVSMETETPSAHSFDIEQGIQSNASTLAAAHGASDAANAGREEHARMPAPTAREAISRPDDGWLTLDWNATELFPFAHAMDNEPKAFAQADSKREFVPPRVSPLRQIGTAPYREPRAVEHHLENFPPTPRAESNVEASPASEIEISSDGNRDIGNAASILSATFPNSRSDMVTQPGIVPLAREIGQVWQHAAEFLPFPSEGSVPETEDSRNTATQIVAPGITTTDHAATSSPPTLALQESSAAPLVANAHRGASAVTFAPTPAAVPATTALTSRHAAPILPVAANALDAFSGHLKTPVMPAAPTMELRHPPLAQAPVSRTAAQPDNSWRGQLTASGEFTSPFGSEMNLFDSETNEPAALSAPAPAAAAAFQPTSSAPTHAGQPTAVDLNAIARQVYKLLQSDLRIERERRQVYSR